MKLPNFKRILFPFFYICIALLFVQCGEDETSSDDFNQDSFSKNAVYLDDNGITVKAKEGAYYGDYGDYGEINGVIYTLISKEDLRNKIISGEDVTQYCTSKITDMNRMFSGSESFNQDLSNWDVSKVISYENFSYGASSWTLPKPNFQ